MNNPDTLIVIHTYKGNEQRVRDLMPFWQAHQQPVLVLSPAAELDYEDENGQKHDPKTDPSVSFDVPGVTFRSGGYAGWKGSHTIHRQIEHWKIAAEYEQDWYMMYDDDAMCLTARLPEYLFQDTRMFWSNEIGTHYLNYEPPYFFSREVLLMLIAAADDPTSRAMKHVNSVIHSERGTLERLLAAAKELDEMSEAEQLTYKVTENEFPYEQLMFILENPDTIERQLEDNIKREAMPDWGGCNAIDGFYVAISEYLGLPHSSFPNGVHHYPKVVADTAGPLVAKEGWDIFHGIKDKETAKALVNAHTFWRLGQSSVPIAPTVDKDLGPLHIGDTIRI